MTEQAVQREPIYRRGNHRHDAGNEREKKKRCSAAPVRTLTTPTNTRKTYRVVAFVMAWVVAMVVAVVATVVCVVAFVVAAVVGVVVALIVGRVTVVVVRWRGVVAA